MEYLRQLRSVVERLAENINADKAGECAAAVTDEKGVRTEAQTPADRRCERNMDKGRVAYVRLDTQRQLLAVQIRLPAIRQRQVPKPNSVNSVNHVSKKTTKKMKTKKQPAGIQSEVIGR